MTEMPESLLYDLHSFRWEACARRLGRQGIAAARLGHFCVAGHFKAELRSYLKPSLLLVDELGYLPVDRTGADLLFQVISQRYERSSIVLTTKKQLKKWPEIFCNDSTLTSAVLDRILHHAPTIPIEGPSYRMKDRIDA